MIDIGKYLQAAFDDGYAARDKEIVRCRECKYYEDECCWREIQFMNAPEPNAFCSYGERKEKDDARID